MFVVSGKFFFLEFLVEVHFKQMLKFPAVEKRPLAEMLDPGSASARAVLPTRPPPHQSLKTCSQHIS